MDSLGGRIFFLLVLADLFVGVTAESQLTFINRENSLIKLRPSAWLKNSLIFHLRTNGDDGNVLTIVNKDQEKLHFSLLNGVFQLNQPREPTISETCKHLLDDWNEISLFQDNDVENKKLQITVNNKTRLVVADEKWGMGNWQEAWLGAFRSVNSQINGSFIGCLKFTHAHHHVNHLLERRSLILDNCADACTIQSCQNGGKCINNYRNITCDCLGTGYEGKTCEKEALAIQSNHNNYIKLQRLPTTNAAIRKVALRMKTRQSDGILFQSDISKEAIRIVLHNGSLHVKVNTAREKFSTNVGEMLHDDQWHSFILSISSNKIKVNLDGHLKNTIEMRNLLNSRRSEISNSTMLSIVISGSESVDEGNFVGCLQQIHVNDVNVINSIQQNDGYFKYVGEFQSCSTT